MAVNTGGKATGVLWMQWKRGRREKGWKERSHSCHESCGTTQHSSWAVETCSHGVCGTGGGAAVSTSEIAVPAAAS